MDEKILIEIILISVGLLCIVTGGVTKLIYKRKYKIVIGTVEKNEVRLRSDRADYSVTALYNGNMRVTGLYAGRLEGVNIFSKEEEREKALSA